MLTNQGSSPDSGQILRHQYGIYVIEVQTFREKKCPKQRGERWNGYIYIRRLAFLFVAYALPITSTNL